MGEHLSSVTSAVEDELAGVVSLTVLEETLSGSLLAGECLLILIRIGEESRLVALGRPFDFGPVVDAELTRFRAIEARVAIAVIHVRTEVLERGFDARFSHFELTIVPERGLPLNFDFWSVPHLN